jgi:hypothetical protein
MKQIILFLLLAPFTAFTQSKEPTLKKIYAGLGIGGAASNGFVSSVGLRAVLKKDWTLGLTYYSVEKNPKNLPSDYEQGYFLVFLEPFPSVNMNLVALTAGKLFPLGRKVWLSTDAGFTFVNGEEMTFTRQSTVNAAILKTSNYATTTNSKSGVGGIVKADLDWAFLPFMGIGFGGFASFNSIESPVGFQIKLIVGKMGTRRQ